MKEPNATTFAGDLVNFARGFCMGAADSVPGVSGGTVALILGHYDRLVTAISHFDAHAVRLLIARRWQSLVEYLDLRFLVALGIGIALAIGSLVHLMHWLLENRFSETMAVFFGLIVASIWLVARQITVISAAGAVGLIVSAAIAYAISSLSPVAVQPSYPYLFVSGMIAITAMILPGISGAFVLVLLGVYHHVTGLLKPLIKLQFTLDTLLQIIVFASGCAIGLAAFTRLLRWLLEHYRDTTFACLLGLMIGSLKRVWPLQQPTVETAHEKFSHRIFEFIPPGQWTGPTTSLVMLAIVAFVAVLALELLATGARPADKERRSS